jgi:hypothetical protein
MFSTSSRLIRLVTRHVDPSPCATLLNAGWHRRPWTPLHGRRAIARLRRLGQRHCRIGFVAKTGNDAEKQRTGSGGPDAQLFRRIFGCFEPVCRPSGCLTGICRKLDPCLDIVCPRGAGHADHGLHFFPARFKGDDNGRGPGVFARVEAEEDFKELGQTVARRSGGKMPVLLFLDWARNGPLLRAAHSSSLASCGAKV